jgi:hypothetical protein
MDYNTFIGAVLLIALVVSVAYMAYRYGARGGSDQLATIRADVEVLDRVEGAVNTKFTADQLELFRMIVFPAFALGLAITPDGDLDTMIGRAKELVDVLTDRKPNVAPAPAPELSGAPGTGG